MNSVGKYKGYTIVGLSELIGEYMEFYDSVSIDDNTCFSHLIDEFQDKIYQQKNYSFKNKKVGILIDCDADDFLNSLPDANSTYNSEDDEWVLDDSDSHSLSLVL